MARVLIVDDSPTEIHVLSGMLEKNGHQVDSVDNAEAGIARSKETKPELILMDVVMPGMNGRELAERLQSLRPEVKVLYMSGYTDNVVDHRILEQGVNFVAKPFSPEGLARKVREVLEQ